MPNFENKTPTQESSDKQFDVADTLHKIDKLQIKADGAIDKTTAYLDNQETPLTPEKINVIRSMGKIFKKIKILRAVAVALTLTSSQPAFADGKAMTLQDRASYSDTDYYIDPIDSISINDLDIDVPENPEKDTSLDFLNSIFVENDTSANPKATPVETTNFHEQALLNSIDMSENVLSTQIDNYSKRTLRGVTYNGGAAHEIAPGIYGDENTIYRRNADGSTISNGGMRINK